MEEEEGWDLRSCLCGSFLIYHICKGKHSEQWKPRDTAITQLDSNLSIEASDQDPNSFSQLSH
jgi:hypothetical protein